jgi:hypothetical protein
LIASALTGLLIGGCWVDDLVLVIYTGGASTLTHISNTQGSEERIKMGRKKRNKGKIKEKGSCPLKMGAKL